MHIEKIVAAFVLATGLLTGFGSALAADGDATAANLDKLQEQFRVLDKDVSVLKEVSASKLDAQDKRISDIGLATAQQANHLSAISNQTTTVGSFIAVTSVVITVFVFVAGFVTYLSATRRVKEESREWFEKNTAKLHSEIEVLREKTRAASGEIERHTQQVVTGKLAALQDMKIAADEFGSAAGKILQSMQLKDDGRHLAIDPESAAVVERASDELKTKPESSFTAEDHFARGLSYFAKGNHLSALESFQAASQAVPEPTLTDAPARYLFAQGVTLGILDQLEEAVSVYDELDRRFGNDESPGAREQVARGLLFKGVTLGKLGKLEEEIAAYDELDRRFGQDKSPEVREQVTRGLLSKGATLCKLDKSEEEIAVYDEMDRRFGNDETLGVRVQVAGGLFNKGVTLGALHKSEKAIAVYDAVDERFGKDESPDLRKQVAKGLFNKGATLGRLDKSEEAIAVYDEMDRRFGKDESLDVREHVSGGLFNKGVTLGKLDKPEEAIAVYNEIDRRFGKDESPGLCSLVTKARNAAACTQINSAKQHWGAIPRKTALLAAAIKRLESALLICADDDRAMVSGNLGYALFLRGDHGAAGEPTRDCLKLGGGAALAAQQDDAKRQRVEPEDRDYEALLTRLWAELHPASGPSGARSQEDS